MIFVRIQDMDACEKVKTWWDERDGSFVLFGTALTAVITYFYYLVLEPLNSDCFVEGFLKYHNDKWAVQLGKWMVPIYAKLSGHIVSPIVYFIIYVLAVSVSAILLADLWGISKRVYRILVGSLMMVAPAITGQIIYIYLFFAFAMSLLLSVISSYVVLKTTDLRWFAAAVVLMACALASYQLYIGDILFIITGSLIIYVLRDDTKIRDTIHVIVKMMLFVALGIGAYWAVMQICLRATGAEEASYAGINNAGIVETLINIPKRVKHTYRIFWWYYRDSKLGGYLFWAILAGAALVCLAAMIIRHAKNKAYWKGLLALFLIVSIPPCANFMYLVLPEHGIQLQMSYQMQLLGPLCIAVISLALSDGIERVWKKGAGVVATICLTGLIIGYSFCAYSSFRTLDIGSRHIKLFIQNAITHAIEDEEYQAGMPIVFLGFVDDDPVQERNPLREYSHFERAYPFWRDQYEVFSTWREYCWYQFGIDIGEVTQEQYGNILASEQFKYMEQYPSNDSYAVIGGCYVILMNKESL